MNHLEEAILKYIEETYHKKYIAGIKVTRLSSGGYKLMMDMGNPDKQQLVIFSDEEDEIKFLEFIKKELKSRCLHRVQYFKDNDLRRTCQQNQCSNQRTCV